MTQKQSLVSIVMPAYNAAAYIRQAIDSIINQTYSNWELLIADDASNDETKAIIDSYTDPRIKTYHNTVNKGYQSTCNKLFALAKGDFITFQDSDDYSVENRIELLINAFVQNPKLGMVGSAYEVVSDQGEFIQTIEKPCTHTEIRAVIQQTSPFCGATLMVTRAVYEEIGLYRPFFEGRSHQDYDWAYRVADKYETMNLKDVLYYYRQSPEGNSKIVSLKRYTGFELAKYLGRQRAETGKDDLMRGEPQKVETYIEEYIVAPFKNDPSLIYRIYATKYMYNRLYKKAKQVAWQAFLKRPFHFINFRTWFYCWRHSLGK